MIKLLALLMFTSCSTDWMKQCDKYKGKRKDACIANLREDNEQQMRNIRERNQR